MRRWLLIGLGLGVAISSVVTIVGVLGLSDDGAESPETSSAPRPTPTDGSATTQPSETGPSTPTYAGLAEYERRCARINRRGALAQVVYEATTKMAVGDSETVTAAVTLNESAPPEAVIPGTDAASELGVVVSCRMQARLSGSKYEFEIDVEGWVNRSVYETDTARWVWSVTPKLGGDHNLTLDVRPIVETRPSNAAAVTRANVRSYSTAVHVTVPWDERPAALMTQIASTLSVGETLVKALTGVILALAALFAALAGIRRGRRGASANDA